MKSGTALAAALVALTSFPILAQQPSPATQPDTPPTQSNPAAQQNPAVPSSPASPASPAAAESAQQNAPAASSPAASSPDTQVPAGPMSAVNGELEGKLDSKTAKTGDNVVVRTKSSVKTADGTEIPKGSKLMGHVIAVQPSAAGTTSQMALQFDHVELKGGQSMSIRSQIQSISPAGGTDMASASSPMNTPMSTAPAGGNSNPAGASQRPSSGAPQGASNAGTAPTPGGAPAPGTVVAQNGNIAIQTTAVPGILLANNTPGQQDPRMAKASSILLGAKRDIELDGGTQMVVGIAAAGGQ